MQPNTPPQRVGFWTLFSQNPDGSLVLQRNMFINGVRFNSGTVVREGALLGGVDFNKRKNSDVAIADAPPDAIILRGFYLQ